MAKLKLKYNNSTYSVTDDSVRDAELAAINEYGAKNLLNFPDKTLTGSSYVIPSTPLKLTAGNYELTFDFSGTSADSQVIIQDSNSDLFSAVFSVISGTNKVYFTLQRESAYIVYYSHAVGDYSKFMIRDTRITDSTYVPYSMTNKQLTERTEKSIEYSGALDNLLKPGFYITASGVTNTPNDSDYHFINNGLFVSGNGANYCSQMIIDTRNQLFSRICNNGVWTSWEGYAKA